MAPLLPPMCLTGAQIMRDGQMQNRPIALAEGRIAHGPFPAIDLSGYLILPGVIDLHGDGFERHMAPRPAAPFPMAAGFASYDREAASHGITTAYLAQGWSWEGGHRSPDYAEALLRGLESYLPQALTDLRVQIRAETHLVDDVHRLIAAVMAHGVGYVVFNDHLGEGLHMARTAPTDFATWARKVGRTADEMAAIIESAAARTGDVAGSLRKLAAAFDGMGVHYGSHDDPDGETRAYYHALGARIAEFPLTRRTAEAAKIARGPVIMGAPNVVRGQSQAGNVSASALAAEGLCDALVSDYHLPALPLAAWAMVDRGVMRLPEAWALISSNPAEILHLQDRGRLDVGMRADLAVINATTRLVEATICAGRLVYMSGAIAPRFVQQTLVAQLAAE